MTALVIHAKSLTDRLQHVEQQLKGWPGRIEYILDYDKDELTDEILRRYIQPGCELDNRSGATSCALKHLLACQYIVDNGLEGALVVEDDIVLHSQFMEKYEKTMEEYRRRYADRPVIISYEDSSLQFIPRSQRVKGQWLYEAPHGRVRFTGILYVSCQAAKAVLDEVQAHKCHKAIDHYYYVYLYDKSLIQMLWCEPCLATQGSFDGTFLSSIGQLRSLEGLRWKVKLLLKKVIYWFR